MSLAAVIAYNFQFRIMRPVWKTGDGLIRAASLVVGMFGISAEIDFVREDNEEMRMPPKGELLIKPILAG